MHELGQSFILFALVSSLYTIGASLLGGKFSHLAWVKSAQRSLWASSLLILGASLTLIAALLTDNFNFQYVYQYSNSTMPSFYKFASFWGGQNGSLLFWVLILSVYSSLVTFFHRNKNLDLMPFVITTLSCIQAFFLILLFFEANPFDLMPFSVVDGRGLNPLLQNYYMIIHPPSLYLGYVGMSVPFAFAMAALISGRLDNQWILLIRRWTLTAWFFLSLGNLLGASWAYEVLGWGGYWAWDPVENAAFMPWLSASAFLHSVIIQEKRNMLKTWNMALVILSFVLTLTGTFLTRSGIVSSVHSFAQSDIGTYFLCFLIFVLVISGGLLIYRLPKLKNASRLDSIWSREAAFLLNNLVLVGAAFAILWGTLFPVLSEALRGIKITVGAPYFNKVMVPIGLALLLLTGIGPIIAWKKTTVEQLKKNFLWPILACVATSIPVYFFVSPSVPVVLSFSFCAFVLATIYLEYYKGITIRISTLKESFSTALIRLVSKNERRYGGYIVHFGIVLLFIGFTGSAFKIEKETRVKQGDYFEIGDYTIQFDQVTPTQNAHKDVITARFSIWKNQVPFAYMDASKVFYRSQIPGEPAQPSTEASIRRSLIEDLYLALISFEPENRSIYVKAIVNPLVQWIWIGGLFLILGTVVVMWPKNRLS
ncbi:MAG: heme lyase CcmF/NrfE family subunit, partial [Bdellovibrionales bacterium]|nr:heme lyase CcmF/NrfE family subunit [Bdellovibrionales bacterium]